MGASEREVGFFACDDSLIAGSVFSWFSAGSFLSRGQQKEKRESEGARPEGERSSSLRSFDLLRRAGVVQTRSWSVHDGENVS